jgi:hypothetical protein
VLNKDLKKMVGDNKTYKEPDSDISLNFSINPDPENEPNKNPYYKPNKEPKLSKSSKKNLPEVPNEQLKGNPKESPKENPKASQEEESNKFKSFIKRYRGLIIAILAIVLTIIVVFIIDRCLKTVHLNLPTDGLSISYQTDNDGNELTTDTPVRLLSYNADAGAPSKLLYYIDTLATVDPDNDTLYVKWQVPNEARYRSTYTELCILDNSNKNENVDGYCKEIGSSSVAYDAVYSSTTDIYPNTYNKISCSYYVSAHSVGLTATLAGWNRLSDDQLVGCAGSAKANGYSWGDESFINSIYSIYAYNSSINSGLTPNTGVGGVTMENLFQSIINSFGGNSNGAEVIQNSFTDNFSYNSNTQQIDLSTTGVLSGESCNLTYNRTYSRPSPVNGSDNTTTQAFSCIPILNVDKYGRITSVSSYWISYDSTVGNEVVGVYGMHSGLTRHGSGTANDPYTLSVNVNKGLIIDDNNKIEVHIGGWQNDGTHSGLEFTSDGVLRISAPKDCNTTDNTVLGWDDTKHEFSCITFTDNYGIDTNYKNTVITRTGDVIDYNLGETGVIASNDNYYNSSHIPSQNDDAKDINAGSTYEADIEKITYQIPRLTVDKYGRLLSTGTTNAFTLSVGAGINMDESGNITIDQGIGLLMLCPIYDPSGDITGYTDTNCADKDKQLVINIGGDNNMGTGSGDSGLTINQHGNLTVNTGKGIVIDATDNTVEVNVGRGITINNNDNTVEVNHSDGLIFDNDGKLKINAPTCTNLKNTAGDTNSNGANVTNSQPGRLVWDGSAFKCEMISTQTSQSFGSNTKSLNSGTLTLGSIATINVDANGELTFGTTAVTITDGSGVTISSNGTISLPGITDGTAICSTAGQGLYWTGSGFACTTAYSWVLQAASTNSTTITAGSTVNFATGGGLAISKSGNTITYTLALSVVGTGLTVNNTNGQISLMNCTNGQVLKATSATNGWACGTDVDTTYSSGNDNTVFTGTQIWGRIKYTSVSLGAMGGWSTSAWGNYLCSNTIPFTSIPANTSSGTLDGQTVLSVNFAGAYDGFITSIVANGIRGCYLGSQYALADNPWVTIIYYDQSR